jgi:very-short-patch-repair endonuclease
MAKYNNNKKSMHYGATKSTFKKADDLRTTMTTAENKLWEHLKGKQILGLRFRRQHPIGQFIVDFYCHKSQLIVEVDGEIHNNTFNREYDNQRSYELNNLGLTVIRFTNDQVIKQIDNVIQKITEYCQTKIE